MARAGSSPWATFGKVGRGELDEALVGQVNDGAIVAVALLLRAHALHRLQERILPVPEIDAARRRRTLGRRRRGGRRSADIEPLAILREARRGLIAHDHPGGHAPRGRRYQLGCRRLTRFPVVDPVRRDVLVVLGLVAEEGELRARIVEGEALVVALALEERDGRAIAHLARERAVLFGFRRRDARTRAMIHPSTTRSR